MPKLITWGVTCIMHFFQESVHFTVFFLLKLMSTLLVRGILLHEFHVSEKMLLKKVKKTYLSYKFFCDIKLILLDSSHKKKKHMYEQYFFKKCCEMHTLLQKVDFVCNHSCYRFWLCYGFCTVALS